MNGIKIIVKGRVQGVGFRVFTKQQATAFEIEGFVKNLYDGDVHIEAFADAGKLELFTEMISLGNSYSRVSRIVVSELLIENNFSGFSIR
ncbi:MAG: hypothetical protein B6226_01860 [Candidatus Cloacimonetes bacterium 4572_65]|nr:MAG: hypothetical protein B6226_01860 [Candidatus Cloacimonetes bacterium 4572_65]